MKLIVGLGNPGNKYALNRHNIGFILVDYIADRENLSFKPGKGEYYFAEGKDFYLLKPTSYMNNSGIPVSEFMEMNEVKAEDVLIVLDDFQLPLGTIRVRPSGSDGGQNGLADIIYRLNTDEISRMRVGIGKDKPPVKDDFVNFVLENFSKEEIEVIKKLLPTYKDCIFSFINDGVLKTMNSFNKNFLID
jgi:peptidyl-tRNA hydrolase, PTH1 family